MADVVVDTDVVSYLFRDDPLVEFYRPHLTGNRLLISFMTLAEMLGGAMYRNWGRRRQEELRRFLGRHFVLVPVDEAICECWDELTVQATRKGRVLRCADAWLPPQLFP